MPPFFLLFNAAALCRSCGMLAKVYSAAVYGVDAYEIEVNASTGNPVIVVVGLPDAAVKESKDRVTTAVANSGYRWSKGRTTINLAPADVKKEGPSFDLPIALENGRLTAMGTPAEILGNRALLERAHLIHTHRHRHSSGIVYFHPHVFLDHPHAAAEPPDHITAP